MKKTQAKQNILFCNSLPFSPSGWTRIPAADSPRCSWRGWWRPLEGRPSSTCARPSSNPIWNHNNRNRTCHKLRHTVVDIHSLEMLHFLTSNVDALLEHLFSMLMHIIEKEHVKLGFLFFRICIKMLIVKTYLSIASIALSKAFWASGIRPISSRHL